MAIFILPLASILQSMASLSSIANSSTISFNAHILVFHTLSAIMGYSLLIISGAFGLLYIILYYNIKHTKFDVFFDRLPSLEVLNKVREKTTLGGIILLGITILLGFLWKILLYQTIFYKDIKVITVCIIFFVYCINFLLGVFTKTSKVSLSFVNFLGVLLMLFSLIIVNFFFDSFHSFQ